VLSSETDSGGVDGDVGGGNVFIQKVSKVTGNVVLFAALLIEAHPSPASLHEMICGLHLQDRANAREAISHEADQRPVAQTP
jgi:hypothetical protein